MKSEARLESAVFQLTPTRTRCDLVITANGKTEKIASGLLNPFLAHLKTAQDQIAKGGYSIALQPDPQSDAPWFTKGTVKRFVRFVSTPEVLERVSTIESEILQIEKAISIQGNENLGMSTVEDHHQTRPAEYIDDNIATLDADAEKAIVLYKPESHPDPPESNGCTMQGKNSKVQLLRVLETRKTMLQKEQGMAFARAAAAGFDVDHMAHLISFAECFGASRLMEACIRYMELWKRKHETGQWLEIDAAEALSSRSEFASLNASGIMLSGDTRKQKEFGEAWPISDLGAESNGKASNHINAELSSQHLNSDHNRDRRQPSDPQLPLGPHAYFHMQSQHPTFSQWPMHAPPGPPMFQPYPMQGMPYYHSYPGNTPFPQPPYPPLEDARFTNGQKSRRKRHSMDSKDSNVELEPSEMGVSTATSQDDADQNMSECGKEASQGRESRRRHARSGKKQSGRVVIRNINYITSKRHETSGSGSGSASDSETEEETNGIHSGIPEEKHKKSKGYSMKKEDNTKSMVTSNVYDNDEVVYGQEADSGNWQAFQSFLLRAEEKTSISSGDIFAGEKDPPEKRRQNKSGDDPIFLTERDSDVVREMRMAEFDSVNDIASRVRQVASNDELLLSSERRGLKDGQMDSQFKGIECGGGGYRRTTGDDFTNYGQEKQVGSKSSLNTLSEHAGNLDHRSSYSTTDESFMVPFRSGAQVQLGADGRSTIYMDSEFPSSLKSTENLSSMTRNQLSYEPEDLALVPERGVESGFIGYDPARDYDIQVPVDDVANLENRNQETVPVGAKELSRKSDNEKKLKVPQNGLLKRNKDAIMRKGTSSKLNPLAEAQRRAEKLREYKADLQKEKKEKEAEEARRLDALKRERQKRIAARNSSAATQSPSTPKQNRAPLPAKVSPSSYKGSKFSDSEPGSSSPLQKLPMRTSSTGFIDSHKIAKTSRISGSASGLSRSVSSLPELNKEATFVRTKRLSDPKGSNIHRTSLKPGISDRLPKKKLPDDPHMKISAIMQLDKTKSATLPELKIKTSRAPTAVQKSVSKATQKGTGSKTSLISESIQARKSNEKPPRFSNIDDNPVLDPVIEKTVVMLETETVPAPMVQASDEIIDTKYRSDRDDGRDRTGLGFEYEAIHVPPSQVIASEADYSSEFKLVEQLNPSEVVISKDGDEKSSNSTMTRKPYQAPYARATSVKDPATSRLEYSEALSVLSSEVITVTDDNFRVRAPSSVDSDLIEHSQEVYDKPRSKESKGFRKLLKFGRKSHGSASGEGNQDSDGLVVDDNATSAPSNDVHILKNLISQDDVPLGGTPPKVSRPFSLLSPFRSKTSEKKLAVA